MKNKDKERRNENTTNFKKVNYVKHTSNCNNNIYLKENELKNKQKKGEIDYINNEQINLMHNSMNINMYTNENKMRDRSHIDEIEKKKRLCFDKDSLEIDKKCELNNDNYDVLKNSIPEVSDNIALYEEKKEENCNNVITSFVYDIEIRNLKWKNKFKMVDICGSENKFLSLHDEEANQNINNNVNSENTNNVISNNLNNRNNDLSNNNTINELSMKNSFNNSNTIFSYRGNQYISDNDVNNIVREEHSSPVRFFNNSERKQSDNCNNLNNQEIRNISSDSKTDECNINHEKNEISVNFSNKSSSLKNNSDEENMLRVKNTNEHISNENVTNENNINNIISSENNVNNIISSENNVNNIISSENNVNNIISSENNMNINTQSEYFSNINNENGVVNNTIRSRNFNENFSNTEELDYYVLTISDLRNSNENQNEEEQQNFPKPLFISRIFGYEIKPNLEEYNMNRVLRATLFILILLILFSVEFALLYNNILKLKIDSKLILVESNYNSIFLTNFLFQFDEKELNNLKVTNDIIKEEINNGNYMLYNNMCVLLKKLKVTCNNLIDYYKTDNENVEKLYENTIRAFKELSRKDIIIYRVKESVFVQCNDITTRNIINNDNNLFLYVLSKKYLKISKLFLIITIFFFIIRVALILSRILYEFAFLSCYRNYKLSLKCKRMYLAKYICSVCTILILEIILGDDCIIWWLHDVDPLFNYHFQYFIWIISMFCFFSFVLYKILRKHNGANNNEFSAISFSLKFLYEFLFGANILFACIFILLNVHKTTILTIIVTTVVLLIDILNDSYIQQVQVTSSQPQPSNRSNKKKFYVIENKKKRVDNITLIRINEHIYRETTSDNISKNIDTNKDCFDSSKKEDNKWWNKKRNVFNLRNIFNNKYLDKKKDSKKSINISNYNSNTYNSNKIKDLNSSTLEYCEICDERCKNVVLNPCMHGGFCETCIRSMIMNSLKSKDSLPHCPFCRDKIKNVYKISFEDDQQKVQANIILTIKTK